MTSGTKADGPAARFGEPAGDVPTERELLELARLRAELAGDLATELTGSLNLRRTVLRVLDVVRPRLADWAMLALPEARSDRLALHGGQQPFFVDAVPHGSAEGLGHVLRSGRAELLHLALGPGPAVGLEGMIPHERLRAEVTALRPAHVLGLPLTARGVTIGVLVLVRGAGRTFGADDVALAGQLAGRAAMALDSAGRYEDRTHVVSVLQAGLRPPALPHIDGVRLAARFRPAAEHLEIGGDFYDVHGSGQDWLVVLGDVCGKDVEAAVLTGRARQSLRTVAYFDRRPAGVLAALNHVLYDEDSDRFVTVACARLRLTASGAEVDVAVAGHPPPVVLRADGRVQEIAVRGIVAGVLPTATYRQTTVRLGRGDVMLLFTDGIYEARGPGGFYGMQRLLDLLPAYATAGPDILCEAVEQDVVEHLGGRTHDDMALFAVACGR
ncbi:MAG TPA: GAF domain-containing SpoIIE family protein phosphatase [Pseudonocardiaceae bacterium]